MLPLLPQVACSQMLKLLDTQPYKTEQRYIFYFWHMATAVRTSGGCAEWISPATSSQFIRVSKCYKKLQVENEDWFNERFKGWGLNGWALSVVKTGLLILVIIIVVLLIVPWLFMHFYKILQKSFNSIFLIKREDVCETSLSSFKKPTIFHHIALCRPVEEFFCRIVTFTSVLFWYGSNELQTTDIKILGFFKICESKI